MKAGKKGRPAGKSTTNGRTEFVALEMCGDKYSFEAKVEMGCEDRLYLCHAVCCRLLFPLSRQDLEEGKVRWDRWVPYLNEQLGDGYCCHLNRTTLQCNIWLQRPVVCRAFDCRSDRRIWLDFGNKIVNPLTGRRGGPLWNS